MSRVLRWGGSLLLLLVLSFGAGFMVGGRPVGELNRRAADAEARAVELEARLDGYRALSLLHQAILDLDAQNFGVANARLDELVNGLSQRGGEQASEIDAIRSELAALDIRVDADLAGQRATLSALARRLAEALGG